MIYCETQISKTNNLKVTIGELKFVSRTIRKAEGVIPRSELSNLFQSLLWGFIPVIPKSKTVKYYE